MHRRSILNKKAARYQRIIEQLNGLYQKTENKEARLASALAVLHHKMSEFFWTGVYRIVNGKLLVFSYQGSLACLELPKNVGVCWAAINNKKTIIVQDVSKFQGHIACDSRSKSEIVIPIYHQNKIWGVLDVDSKNLNSFDETDAKYLEQIVDTIFNNQMEN